MFGCDKLCTIAPKKKLVPRICNEVAETRNKVPREMHSIQLSLQKELFRAKQFRYFCLATAFVSSDHPRALLLIFGLFKEKIEF